MEEDEIERAAVFLGVLDPPEAGAPLPYSVPPGTGTSLPLSGHPETGSPLPHFALDISGLNEALFRTFHPEAEALTDRRGVFTLGKG